MSSLRVSPVVLVLGGIVSVQVGASFAKLLFDEVSPTTLVWLRLATSALLLWLIARPRLSGRFGSAWLTAVGLGVSLASMNWAIYESFARIPLGLAVTIEFLGPLTLGLLGARRWRDGLWVLLAGLGVATLGLGPGEIDPLGVLLALLAGACWASYIVLSQATGQRWEGLDGLTVASVVGALILSVPTLVGGGIGEVSVKVLLIGACVGVLSSVVPYSLEMQALRTIKTSLFGILMSLEPAAATLAGLVVLGELLSPLQWFAVACVVVASIGATRTSSPTPQPGG